MKRKEYTTTMKLSKKQRTHLKSLGEEENIGNYDGDYKLIKNGSTEYDEVLNLMDKKDKIRFNLIILENSILMMDNVKIHYVFGVSSLINTLNLEYYYLPPY
eukprot:gene12358-6026_t